MQSLHEYFSKSFNESLAELNLKTYPDFYILALQPKHPYSILYWNYFLYGNFNLISS